MKLLGELQRRNVFRVAVLYVVGSWLLLQVGDLLFDLMGLPDFALRIVLGILLLGFPAALVFAWVFELTPEGLRRDTGSPPAPRSTAATSNKLNVAVIVTTVAALVVLGADRLMLDPGDGASVPPVPAPAVSDGTGPLEGAIAPTVAETNDASIAVLPFLNLSSDPEQEYFSDGLADTLLHRLAQVPDLRVAARTSAFKFKGRDEDVRDIAAQLGVATVLEGSVQRQGDRIRITAQLISGSDGSHLWSEVFDDTLDDIFRVQDEISAKVTQALTSALLGQATGPGADTGGTGIVEAYEAYLRGQRALDQGTPEGASEAVAQLQLAVALDPAYARAWARLVDAHWATAVIGTVAWEATWDPMMDAATRAVALAPDLVEAHLALASVYDARREDALWVAAVEQAYGLGSNNARAVAAMAKVASDRGQHRDALRLTERALLLSPLDSDLKIESAYARLRIGNAGDAVAIMRAVVAENPGDLDARLSLARVLSTAGQPVEAGHELHSLNRTHPDYLRAYFFLSDLWAVLGDADQAMFYLEQAEVIAPSRAIDDRAALCYLLGDMACYRAGAERLIAYQRDAGDTTLADIEQAALLLRTGQPNEAIKLLRPMVEADGLIDVSNRFVSEYLAQAYDLAGDTTARDRVLDAKDAKFASEIANGLWPRLVVAAQVRVAVLRGDLARALDLLPRALETDITSMMLEHDLAYARLRDHPAYADVLAQARAREAAWRRELKETLEL